ncbi:MAG: two-component system cell cycle response regulator DivK [Lentimonas sp.]|jgi:two-component system cell cycle response regulator DivK
MSDEIEPKNVMIIEDNQLNQKIADMIIKQLGHDTIQVYEGIKAIETAKKEKPVLIILDIKLPDISGIDICKELKADEELRKIPVIVVTALSSAEEKRHIIAESGCDNYIAKPFLPHMFADAIGRYIPVRQVDWGI